MAPSEDLLREQIDGAKRDVEADGTLVDAFMLIFNFKNAHGIRGESVAVLRSTDKGVTWSGPTIVSKVAPAPVTDPTTGHDVRTEEAQGRVTLPEALADAPRSGRIGGRGVALPFEAPPPLRPLLVPGGDLPKHLYRDGA